MTVSTAILCGGPGTRLHPVIGTDLPKCLAPVNGRPFLSYVLDHLQTQGVRHVVLCVGFRAGKVWDTYVFPQGRHGDIDIRYSLEQAPAGTGGAARYALDWLPTDPALVLNGDTYCRFDLKEMLAWYRRQDNSDGLVVTGTDVVDGVGKRAGAYLLSRKFLTAFTPGVKCDLEDDELLAEKKLQLVTYGPGVSFLDIGTPDGYAKAPSFLCGGTAPPLSTGD